MLPVGEAGVAAPLLVTAEVNTGLVVVQERETVEEQVEAPNAMAQVAVAGVSVPDMAPVLLAVPVPLFAPPLLPLQIQVVELLAAGKAVLEDVPEAH